MYVVNFTHMNSLKNQKNAANMIHYYI